jgi:GTP cyclohydrolase II
MEVHIGPKIALPTQHGKFDVLHVVVQDGRNIIREGVILQKLTTQRPLTVRVQSSCLFSETFWATDCDCALQLQSALSRISLEGGLLLYFYEEGRGAGLAAKFKAIELQQVKGFDTRQAYECLRMGVDERSYEAAAATLVKVLKDSSVCLLSNNPDKIEGLKNHGVNIVSSEQLIVGTDSPAVRQYLEEKRRILGHNIPNFNDKKKGNN